MKCDEIKNLITAYLLGDLDDQASAAVREHLDTCDGCRVLLQEIEPTLDLLRGALAATSSSEQKLPELKKLRILQPPEPEVRPQEIEKPNVLAWMSQHNPRLAAIAAIFLVGFLFVSVLLPGLMSSKKRAIKIDEMARMKEMGLAEELGRRIEEADLDSSDYETMTERMKSLDRHEVEAVMAELKAKMDATEKEISDYKKLHDAGGEAVRGEKDDNIDQLIKDRRGLSTQMWMMEVHFPILRDENKRDIGNVASAYTLDGNGSMVINGVLPPGSNIDFDLNWVSAGSGPDIAVPAIPPPPASDSQVRPIVDGFESGITGDDSRDSEMLISGLPVATEAYSADPWGTPFKADSAGSGDDISEKDPSFSINGLRIVDQNGGLPSLTEGMSGGFIYDGPVPTKREDKGSHDSDTAPDLSNLDTLSSEESPEGEELSEDLKPLLSLVESTTRIVYRADAGAAHGTLGDYPPVDRLDSDGDSDGIPPTFPPRERYSILIRAQGGTTVANAGRGAPAANGRKAGATGMTPPGATTYGLESSGAGGDGPDRQGQQGREKRKPDDESAHSVGGKNQIVERAYFYANGNVVDAGGGTPLRGDESQAASEPAVGGGIMFGMDSAGAPVGGEKGKRKDGRGWSTGTDIQISARFGEVEEKELKDWSIEAFVRPDSGENAPAETPPESTQSGDLVELPDNAKTPGAPQPLSGSTAIAGSEAAMLSHELHRNRVGYIVQNLSGLKDLSEVTAVEREPQTDKKDVQTVGGLDLYARVKSPPKVSQKELEKTLGKYEGKKRLDELRRGFEPPMAERVSASGKPGKHDSIGGGGVRSRIGLPLAPLLPSEQQSAAGERSNKLMGLGEAVKHDDKQVPLINEISLLGALARDSKKGEKPEAMSEEEIQAILDEARKSLETHQLETTMDLSISAKESEQWAVEPGVPTAYLNILKSDSASAPGPDTGVDLPPTTAGQVADLKKNSEHKWSHMAGIDGEQRPTIIWDQNSVGGMSKAENEKGQLFIDGKAHVSSEPADSTEALVNQWDMDGASSQATDDDGLDDDGEALLGVDLKQLQADLFAQRSGTVDDFGGVVDRVVYFTNSLGPFSCEDIDKSDPQDSKKTEDLTGPRFKAFGVNPFVSPAVNAFSTFAIDVDTASYTLARNYMNGGFLPPAEAVRTEEFLNFFDYGYSPPEIGTFKIYTEMAPSKFGRGLHTLKIGVKGKRLGREEQRPAVLTFLIDTSGSMETPDRLGLLQKSLRMLVEELAPNDQVSIIQYDSHARLVLAHTPASQKAKILEVIDKLQCGGSTNLEEGMGKAYAVAAGHFKPGAENRVLILSDGVANLGAVTAEHILEKVAHYRKQGIFSSVFGFGKSNYDDTMLEALANKGDGSYTFIDSEEEAKRVFVDDLAATLNTIASDVKIQVEFNKDAVKRYRQLGYENRQLTKEQFRDDTVDAGEVGSGQSVTALYEVEKLPDSTEQVVATVRVRYRRIDSGKVEEIEQVIREQDVLNTFNASDSRFRLATAVAEFSEILRGSPHAAGSDFEEIAAILRPVSLELDLDSRVQELLRIVNGASGMSRGE